jgi:hypothetical protein
MSVNTAPFEIIAQPFEVWVAAVGTAFPAIDATPSASWTKLGTSGARNMTDAGVKVAMSQKIETFRPLGSTGPVKAFRTEEDLTVSFTLADLSLEALKPALNGNAVDTATAGQKAIGLSRGIGVTRYAVLVRGDNASPYIDGQAQFEIPIAVMSSSPEPTFTKGGDPASLAFEFMALEDPSAASDDERFGRLVADSSET